MVVSCLQERRENILHAPKLQRRSAQFTSQLTHTLEECKKFKEMSSVEKEKVLDKHCLSCLLPGHRLKKCPSVNRCKVEGCGMRHHTLVHDVDLKFIERARVKRESERVPEGERDQEPASQKSEGTLRNQAVEPREEHHHSSYSGHEAGGCALVEVLPVVMFGKNGNQRVMALRDSGCNTTLIDEGLAQSLGLRGKEIDLEIQGVNAQKAFTSHFENFPISTRSAAQMLSIPYEITRLFGKRRRIGWCNSFARF